MEIGKHEHRIKMVAAGLDVLGGAELIDEFCSAINNKQYNLEISGLFDPNR